MPPTKPAKVPHESGSQRDRAVLVGVQLPGVTDAEHASDLAELARLVDTLGFDVAATVTQRRDALAAAAVLGEGKLKELAALTGGKGVVPSGAPEVKTKARARWEAGGRCRRRRQTTTRSRHETRPEQGDASSSSTTRSRRARRATSSARPARACSTAPASSSTSSTGTRGAARRASQVEIARLNYVAPRLRESPGGKERQRGKGAGEAAIELDRRKIRDRIAELREQLAAIQKEQENRRHARQDQLRVALVGYTNAGKSSLMRALTGSQVLVEDKLFATLDTTVRALQPETQAAHPGLRHRRLHQEAAARSRRVVPVDARRGARGVAPPLRRRRRRSRPTRRSSR